MSAEERNRYRARGWAIVAAIVIPFWLILGGLTYAAVSAHAEPNEQTQLPANGVLSIVRDGDTWTVTTTGPASEIKYMGPGAQQIICGTNYGDPCTTVETFTATGECVYLQLDGIPGENSSDPYVCRGGTSSTPTPVETEPVPTSPAPMPTTTPGTTSSPQPSESPTPTSDPSQSPSPSVTPYPTSTSGATSTSTPSSGSSHPTSPTASALPAPDRLADTGTDAIPALAAFAVIVIAIGVTTVWGRRKGLERFGSKS